MHDNNNKNDHLHIMVKKIKVFNEKDMDPEEFESSIS